MKLIKYIVIFLVVIVAALAVASQLLPSSFRFERSLIIKAGPDKIHPHVNNLRNWPQWTVWNTANDPTLAYTYDGPAEGAGAISKWQSQSGPGSMTLTESDPAKGVKFDLVFGKGNPTQGSITYASAGTDTKVIWAMSGEVSRNPVERWFGVFLERLIAPDLEKCLAGLKQKAENSP